MKKQEIYQELFMWGMPHIRNVQTWSYFKKGRDRSCYFVAELLHNLYVSMFEEEFTDHDIWFINVQMRYFIESCNPKIFNGYTHFCSLLLRLLDEVPDNLKEKIQWTPSKETVDMVTEFRENQKQLEDKR